VIIARKKIIASLGLEAIMHRSIQISGYKSYIIYRSFKGYMS
jgi:hypothetical protein